MVGSITHYAKPSRLLHSHAPCHPELRHPHRDTTGKGVKEQTQTQTYPLHLPCLPASPALPSKLVLKPSPARQPAKRTNKPANAYTASIAIIATRAADYYQPLLHNTLPVAGPACIPVAVQSSRTLHRDSTTPASILLRASLYIPPLLHPRPYESRLCPGRNDTRQYASIRGKTRRDEATNPYPTIHPTHPHPRRSYARLRPRKDHTDTN